MRGKQRWVEKTPTHLVYLHEVRRHYPHAPIVRIVRDPRDVALSLLNVAMGSIELHGRDLAVALCRRSQRLFFEADRNSLTLRSEDLVVNPEGELEGCAASSARILSRV